MKNKRKTNYRNKYTEHHKIPSSRWWTSFTDNVEKIKKTVHMWFHNVFQNALYNEQLHMLHELNKSTLTPEALEVVEKFKYEIYLLLKNKNLYKKSCYKKLKS